MVRTLQINKNDALSSDSVFTKVGSVASRAVTILLVLTIPLTSLASNSASDAAVIKACADKVETTRKTQLLGLGGMTLGGYVGYQMATRKLKAAIHELNIDTVVQESRRTELEKKLANVQSLIDSNKSNSNRAHAETARLEQLAADVKKSMVATSNLRQQKIEGQLKEIKTLMGSLEDYKMQFYKLENAYDRYGQKPNLFVRYQNNLRGLTNQLDDLTMKANAVIDQERLLKRSLEGETYGSMRARSQYIITRDHMLTSLRSSAAAIDEDLRLTHEAMAESQRGFQFYANKRQAALAGINDTLRNQKTTHVRDLRALSFLRKVPALVGGATATVIAMGYTIYTSPPPAELSGMKETNLSPEILLNPEKTTTEVCGYIKATGEGAMKEANELMEEVANFKESEVKKYGRLSIEERRITVQGSMPRAPIQTPRLVEQASGGRP